MVTQEGISIFASKLLPHKENPQLPWLKLILEESLDEFTARFLKDSRPDEALYSINAIEENLNEASRLLDVCIQQRDRMHNLEASALFAAYDYITSEEIDGIEESLQLLNAKALVQMADGLAGVDVNDLIPKKLSFIKAARDAKISLHNTEGSALNFGEKIRDGRLIYAQNIGEIFRRIYSCRPILYKYISPWPSHIAWSGLPSSLVIFVRELISSIEQVRGRETQATFVLSALHGGLITGRPDDDRKKIQELLSAPSPLAFTPYRWVRIFDTIDIEFNVGIDDLIAANPTIPLGHDWSFCRISGFSIYLPAVNNAKGGMNTSEERQAYSFNMSRLQEAAAYACFPMDVISPRQEIGGGDFIDSERVQLSPLIHYPSGGGFNAGCPSRIRNLSPFGKWRVRIHDRNSSNGFGTLREHVAFLSYFGVWEFDLIISMTLRFLPSGDAMPLEDEEQQFVDYGDGI